MNSNKERNANGSYTGAVFSSVRRLRYINALFA